MTKEEKALVHILKELNQDQETVIAIILMLSKKKHGASSLIEYLKKSQPNQLTTHNILEKTMEIVSENQIIGLFSSDKEDLLERYVYPKQVYEVFKNEDKSKITKSIEELQKYKETLDSNTDDGWDNNFLANQQIDALESGLDNVYDYLVDREKTRGKTF